MFVTFIVALCVASSAGQGGGLGDQTTGALFRKLVKTPTGENGYEDFLRAADQVMSATHSLDLPRRGATYLEDCRIWARRTASTRRLVQSGTEKPVWYPSETAALIQDHPEMSAFRRVAAAIAASAYVHFADGDTADGVKDLIVGMRFTRRVSECAGGLLATQGMRLTEFFFLRLIDDVFGRMSVRDTLSLRAAILEEIDRSSPLHRVLAADARTNSDVLGSIADGRDWSIWFIPEDAGPFQAEAERALLEADAMSGKDRERLVMAVSRALEEGLHERRNRLTGPIMGWLAPAVAPRDHAEALAFCLLARMDSVIKAEAILQTRLRLAYVQSFVERARLESGVLPVALDEVAPTTAVLDPLTGEGFAYIVHGKSYDLYSVGTPETGPIFLDVTRRLAGGSSG